jgi:hypothetical protein
VADEQFAGMTVSERLFEAGLLAGFDDACRARDRAKMIGLLQKVALHDEAPRIADTILADPVKYGF